MLFGGPQSNILEKKKIDLGFSYYCFFLFCFSFFCSLVGLAAGRCCSQLYSLIRTFPSSYGQFTCSSEKLQFMKCIPSQHTHSVLAPSDLRVATVKGSFKSISAQVLVKRSASLLDISLVQFQVLSAKYTYANRESGLDKSYSTYQVQYLATINSTIMIPCKCISQGEGVHIHPIMLTTACLVRIFPPY